MMRTTLRSLTAAAVTLGFALTLAAADDAKADGKKKGEKAAAEPAAMYKLPDTVTLSDEQKPKVETIKKEYLPKFQELAKKGNDILTPEQRKARREAQKAGKDAGKKQKEIQADVDAAMKLNEDQKKKLDEVKAATAKLKGEMEAKVVAVLTPEQKAQVEAAKKKTNKKAKKAA